MIGIALAAAVGWPVKGMERGALARAQVRYALEHVFNDRRQPIGAVIRGCGFRVNFADSWVARQDDGELVVQILFDQPREGEWGKDTLARWSIRDGRQMPASGWARAIQSSRDPCKPL